MKITIPGPQGWVERPGVTSRAIQRDGYRRYGVIFTTSDTPSPAEFFLNQTTPFDPTVLLGQQLAFQRRGSTEITGIFTIVGGYFAQRFRDVDEKFNVRTLAPFGVAIKSSAEDHGFSTVDGGTVIIGDEWDFFPPVAEVNKNRGFSLNERNSEQSGWTLIVEEAKWPGEFPWSFDPLLLQAECPKLTDLKLVPIKTTGEEITIKAIVNFEGIKPEKFVFNWGDGTESETDEPFATHIFPRQEGVSSTFTVTVVSTIQDCRDEISKETPIPGCPAIETFTVTPAKIVDPLATLQAVKAEVKVVVPEGGLAPTLFTFDWGDGEITETADPIAAHEYKRPFGEDQTFTVTVTTSGKDQCSDSDSKPVTIEKLCPKIIDIVPKTVVQDDDSQTILFTVITQGPKPDSFDWSFGDGEEIKDGKEKEKHTYTRTEGKDKTFTVKVKSNGPGSDNALCSDEKTIEVVVDGNCPSIETIEIEKVSRTKETEKIRLKVLVKGNPDKVEVNWGDGTSEELTDYMGEHEFKCAPDGDKEYAITVTISGPGDCPAQSEVVKVIISCPACPTITGIDCTRMEEVNDQITRVDLEATFTGSQPDAFNWNFGDGATRTTSTATVSHEYKRPVAEGNDLIRAVSVQTSGPGDCAGNASREVRLIPPPPPVLPWYCKYMDMIIALLLALAVGSGVICYVAEYIPGATDSSVPLTLFSIFVVLAIIGVFLWYFLGKEKCPPTRCGWLGAAWTALITGGLSGMYMYADCGLSIVTGVIITLLGGGFLGWWAMTCKDDNKMSKALIYIGIIVLALLILVFGDANPNFPCLAGE